MSTDTFSRRALAAAALEDYRREAAGRGDPDWHAWSRKLAEALQGVLERVPYDNDSDRWQADYKERGWFLAAAWFDHEGVLEVHGQNAQSGEVVKAGSLDELARVIDEQEG